MRVFVPLLCCVLCVVFTDYKYVVCLWCVLYHQLCYGLSYYSAAHSGDMSYCLQDTAQFVME